MARYIDADELWNDRPQFPSGQDAEYDAGFCDCYLAFSELIRKHIDNTTADVVPKSEVEKIFAEIEKTTFSFGYGVRADRTVAHTRTVDDDLLAELKKKYTEGGTE